VHFKEEARKEERKEKVTKYSINYNQIKVVCNFINDFHSIIILGA